MKSILPFLLLPSLALLAQDTPSPAPVAPEIKTVGPVRYQLCVTQSIGSGTSIPVIIEIDTQTGNAWAYQMTNDEMRNKGIPFVFTYIPHVGGPESGR